MFVLYSLVERNQPCLWTAVERSSGPNTRRYSKPTSRLSETRTWRMERGSLWRWRTWAAVRSTPRQSPTTPMAGQCVVVGYQIHTSDAVYTHARNPSISFGLDKSYSCVTGLWWCVGMASTSSTRPWHSGTRVLALPRSLFGAVILQCTPPENPPVLLKSLKTLRNKRHSNQNLGLRVRMKTCLHELKLIESSQYLNTWWSWDQKKISWLYLWLCWCWVTLYD